MKLPAGMTAILLCVVHVAFAQTPDQTFLNGNTLYQQGKFREAIEAYEGILHSGMVSGDVLFNLGNAYYKTGNMGKAILHYERALRLMPADDDLRHNLLLANLSIVDKIEAAPRLVLWEWWDDIKGALTLRAYTWITYLAFLAVIGAIALFVLARSYAARRVAVISGSAATVLLLCLLSVLAAKAADVGRTDEAVVISSITTVKNSPDAKSSDAFVLHAGVKLRIVDSVSTWIKIRLADGKVGWMERSAAEII